MESIFNFIKNCFINMSNINISQFSKLLFLQLYFIFIPKVLKRGFLIYIRFHIFQIHYAFHVLIYSILNWILLFKANWNIYFFLRLYFSKYIFQYDENIALMLDPMVEDLKPFNRCLFFSLIRLKRNIFIKIFSYT